MNVRGLDHEADCVVVHSRGVMSNVASGSAWWPAGGSSLGTGGMTRHSVTSSGRGSPCRPGAIPERYDERS
jgi:hypothetical protein